jgi:DNA-binding MarR family transcriptional regulator
MRVVRDFIDEFYNKTIFKNGKENNLDLPPFVIKTLYAFLDETASYPIGMLGENARVKRSTITDMVDRLENDGLVERTRDPDDRRIVKVRLTDKGRKIKSDFARMCRREFQDIFSQLTKKETDQLMHHLEEAHKLLKKIK